MIETLIPAEYGGKGLDQPPMRTTFDDGSADNYGEPIHLNYEMNHGQSERDVYLGGNGARIILRELIITPADLSFN